MSMDARARLAELEKQIDEMRVELHAAVRRVAALESALGLRPQKAKEPRGLRR